MDVGNFEREEWVESVVIAPAERYIVHAMFPESGVYAMQNRVQSIDHLNGSFFADVDTLGVVRVTDEAASPDHTAEFRTLRRDTAMTSEIELSRAFKPRQVDAPLSHR